MDAIELIERARSALAVQRAARVQPLEPVPYRLGGPVDTQSIDPPAAGFDCSGFVSWAAKLGEVWETTRIVRDALSGAPQLFQRVPDPRRGCLLVYPDYAAVPQIKGAARTEHDGHVAIVSEIVQAVGKPPEISRIIHCSRLVQGMRLNLQPGTKPDGVIESDPLWFPVFKPIVVWCKSIAVAPL